MSGKKTKTFIFKPPFKPLKPYKYKYKKVLGFDIETKGKSNEFVLACFYSEDMKAICNTKQEVLEFLKQKKLANYTIYATNLAFDFLGTLFEYSDFWDISERNGTIYSFKWYQNREQITNLKGEEETKLTKPLTFYDTIRVFPASVEQLGKILNVPKMAHPSCFGKQPKNDKEYTELTEYCMNDAKISYLFVIDIVMPFLEKYQIKNASTIGSIAMKEFRTNHLKITLFPESPLNHKLGFGAFYGGRTETYKRGYFVNIFCFDINSLYPFSMLNLMPNPNKSNYYEKGDIYAINKYEGVSFVKVKVPDMYIPPLPFHHEGKLIFPTGTFSSYYTHVELRNAMKYGVEILEVGEQLIYKKTIKLFETFVLQHYDERNKLKALKNPLEVMEKNVMNNLYGKFSFNYRISSEIIPAHKFKYDMLTDDTVNIQPICDDKFVSLEKKDNDPPIYSFPILSAYITSYARITMFKFLNNPKLKNKIIATDTDSIFLKDYDGEIETSNELGAMKLEDGYPVEKAIFIRPKMYFSNKPKCKGVKFDKELGEQQFDDILKGKKIKQQRFVKLRSVLKSDEHHKYGKLLPNQIIDLEKGCDLEDTKRIWSKPFSEFEEQDSKPLHISQ